MAEASASNSGQDEEMPAHRRRAAILIITVTVLGGVLALYQNHVSDHGSTYTDAAHEQLVRALGERAQAEGGLLLEDQAETASSVDGALSRQPGTSSSGTAGALVAGLASARGSAARELARYSVLGPTRAVLLGQDTASFLFVIRQVEPFERAKEQQEADEQTADAFAVRSENVETAITILAVALFLLGLSHTLPSSRTRALFTVTGLGIALAAGGWGLATAARAVQLPSSRAISAYVRANADFTAAVDASSDPHARALLASARSLLDSALALRPRYAAARFDRASVLEELAQTGSHPHGSPQALADLRVAISAAGDSSVYESVLADIAFWLRRYHAAIVAAKRAVSLSSASLEGSFNLAQYLELSPGTRPAGEISRALKLLRHNYANSPAEMRNGSYPGIVDEIRSVAKYRPALAPRARRWLRLLTHLLGPVPS